jgi:hypothetical protein
LSPCSDDEHISSSVSLPFDSTRPGVEWLRLIEAGTAQYGNAQNCHLTRLKDIPTLYLSCWLEHLMTIVSCEVLWAIDREYTYINIYYSLLLCILVHKCTRANLFVCTPRPARMAWDVICTKWSNTHDVIRAMGGRFSTSSREQKHDESISHGSCANKLLSSNNSHLMQRCSALTLEGNTPSAACKHCWHYQ